MKIHLIAIGGAVMHNLAMALHDKGIRITGSDDEIFEPSRSRLESYGLLPDNMGWDPHRITEELDGVIVGMHAREDNPELLKARKLGLKIWSFPEYIYEQTRDKKRVVIGGSHGKTTVTSMIMHVLWYHHIPFDYMVGSHLEGFDTMVKLSNDTDLVILEGDEYLSSPIDPRPKFHLYKPHIAVLTGIAWDHMNVFPTFEEYRKQFELFLETMEKDGIVYWYINDPELDRMMQGYKGGNTAYEEHPYEIEHETFHLLSGGGKVHVPVFGRHNMQNIYAALSVCRELGIPDDYFYDAISSFKGAARRQEVLAKSDRRIVYLDFAHAPSKVRATLESFRERYPNKKLAAFLELHTFSSLNKQFLPQYKESMAPADEAVVYFNPEVVSHKKLEPLTAEDIKNAFGDPKLEVIHERSTLEDRIKSTDAEVILFMSSGNFSGLDLHKVAGKLI